jgi:hypothetical protein
VGYLDTGMRCAARYYNLAILPKVVTEIAMQLIVPNTDMRSQISGGESIIDRETGKSVGGLVYSYGSHDGRSRWVHLFDGRYSASFATYEECVAFVQGVEQVLNHMLNHMIKPIERKADSK